MLATLAHYWTVISPLLFKKRSAFMRIRLPKLNIINYARIKVDAYTLKMKNKMLK